MTPLASDNFSSGSLASGWITAPACAAKCVVTTSSPYYTEASALSTRDGQIWTALSWPADQASAVTVHTLVQTSNNYLSLWIRYSSSVGSGYRASITNGTALIYKDTAGSATQIGSTATGLTFASGDTWLFQVQGTSLALYQNGIQVVSVSDSTYASGYPGYAQVADSALTENQVASWTGYSLTSVSSVSWLAVDLASSKKR